MNQIDYVDNVGWDMNQIEMRNAGLFSSRSEPLVLASAHPCWDLSSATCWNWGVKVQWAI